MVLPRSRAGFLAGFVLLLVGGSLRGAVPEELTQSLWNVYRLDAGRVHVNCQVDALALPGAQSLELSFQTRADGRIFWRLEGLLQTAQSPIGLCVVQRGEGIHALLAAPDQAPLAKLVNSFALNAPPHRGPISTRRLRNRLKDRILRYNDRAPGSFRRRLNHALRGYRIVKARRATYFIQKHEEEDWLLLVLDGRSKFPRRLRWGRRLDRHRQVLLRCRLGPYEKREAMDRRLPVVAETYRPWDESTGPAELLAWVSDQNLSLCTSMVLFGGGFGLGSH